MKTSILITAFLLAPLAALHAQEAPALQISDRAVIFKHTSTDPKDPANTSGFNFGPSVAVLPDDGYVARFDGSLDAVSSKATIWGKSAPEQAVYEDGLDGHAVRVGRGQAPRSVFFPVKHLLNPDSGTILFWVNPTDWHGPDPDFHVLMRLSSGGEAFMIYKYYDSDNLLFLVGPSSRYCSVKQPIRDWTPGKWHLIACTWSRDEIAMWVDGKLAGSNRLDAPIQFGKASEFSVGPGDWQKSTGSSLIDELRIFDHVLSPSELREEYLRLAGRAGARDGAGLVTVARCSPAVDGVVGEDEYSFLGTGFHTPEGLLSETQFFYSLGYDEHQLYIAVHGPQNGKIEPRLLVAGEDGQSRELRFEPQSEPENTKPNPGQGAGAKWKSQSDAGQWLFEAAIPFPAIGFPQPPTHFRMTLGLVFGGQTVSSAPVVGRLDDLSHFSEIRLRPEAATLKMKGLVDRKEMATAFDLRATGGPGMSVEGGLVIREIGLAYGNTSRPVRLLAGGKSTPYFPSEKRKITSRTSIGISLTETGPDGGRVPFFKGEFVVDSQEPLRVHHLNTLHDDPVRLNVVAERSQRSRGQMEVRLVDAGGKTVFSAATALPENETFFSRQFPLNLKTISPGDYLAEVHFLPEQQAAAVRVSQQEYRVPDLNGPMYAPYRDPDADKVPAPWTPLVATPREALVWGRKYRFDQGFLLSGIESQGQQILAAPIRLSVNGKQLEPNGPPALEMVGSSPLAAEWKTRSDFGSFVVDAAITIHFDGLCEIRMTLSPSGAGSAPEINTLSLDFPLRADAATLVRDSFIHFGTKSGAVGAHWSQTLAQEGGHPMLWVGNERIGLNWAAQDLAHWHYRNASKNVEIQRSGGETALRFHLVDTPLRLDAPREIAFQMMATPSRPLDPALRGFRADKEYSGWVQPWNYFNYFDGGVSQGGIASDLKGLDQGLLYMSHSFFSPFAPEWPYWEQLWITNEPIGRYTGSPFWPDWHRKFGAYSKASLAVDSFRHFHLNQMSRFFRTTPVHPKVWHYYFDDPHPIAGNNPHLPPGSMWSNLAGQKFPRLVLPEIREVMLNTRRMIHRANPESLISSHTGFLRFLSAQHFADLLVIGEGPEADVATRGGYDDILTPELFRATYLSQPLGMKVVFINQLHRALVLNNPSAAANYDIRDPATRRALLHLIGYLLTHDVDATWPGLDHYRRIIETLWDTQDALGWNESTSFFPYWDPDSGVAVLSPESPRILASAYSNDGKLLLAVLNDTAERQTVSVGLDLGKLRAKAGMEGQDVYEPEKHVSLADQVKFEIPARGLRLILFRK